MTIDIKRRIETARLNDPRHPEHATISVLIEQLQDAMERIEWLEQKVSRLESDDNDDY